ncbi:penicillin acylase family protein [Variovorax guangxiensis]|uniref:Penicillin acylase family protein n=1 Tax=Variovorax guangxiensis TaxID=1775474 RepID=A0A502DKM6_9BURK|nr:penicillin acylase family protein [Variovorax guangxiensis]RZI64734.1 MAG: penicillin acylase family protein [Variovorax sp.]TPG22107.1 penicillin acylase family protein [Variovorax ginsengisoli]TPG25995.1 penicillin acylase family protein [Variovorax guangxiensis]
MRQVESSRGALPLSIVALAAAALLSACGGGGGGGGGSNGGGGDVPAPVDPGTPPTAIYKAEIRRTAMGVPHIKADTWAGAGYGYGYAQAEDNLCTMADSFLTYRGERSQFFGGDAQLLASSTIGRPKNIESDFFHRHVISDDVVQKMIAAQPDNLQQLVKGFAAGYNRYVRDVKAKAGANAACANETWVRPVTTNDIYRRMYAANLAGGYSNFLPNISGAIAPAAIAPTQLSARNTARQFASAKTQLPDLQVGGHEGVGSNMIGFGTAATGDSSPLLFGNPHWYWRGPDRFYQAQLTIPGQLNVSGTSFLGIPVILIGFNDNVAWSHTVSTARRFGFFELKLAPGMPTSYLRDGVAVKMQATAITVSVKQNDGGVSPVTRTLYKSEYGPMVNLGALNPALAWNQTTAFAMRDINGDNYRTFRNWLRWNQAKSLDEFIAIQREEAAIPWVNTVAVGRGAAQAWYADIGAVPNVSPAQTASCTTPTGQLLSASLPRVPIFDGSRGYCDWQTDADSAQKGAIGASRMPSLQRDDYVSNMNDSYWLAQPKKPLTGYPDIMGPAGTEAVSFRTRMGNKLAQERLAGIDRYGGNRATSDIVQRMVLNSRVLTAELFKNDALDLVCATPQITVATDPQTKEAIGRDINTGAACAVLRAWDNTGTVASRGAHVWDEFWNRAALLPATTLYNVPFDATDAVNTPRDLKASAAAGLQQAFGAAIARVEASGYALDAKRGDVLFATRSGQKIPLYGGCGGPGYFTIACSENRLDKGGYSMDANPNGNSYMQVVRFPEGGVDARTFLTFSLSDDPASAHNGDYTRAYSAGQWLKVPFSEAEIAGDAALRSTSLSE